MTSSHRIALSDPRACQGAFPFIQHLNWGEREELRRLDEYHSIGGLGLKLSRRYAYLSARRYVPPGIPETPGEAA